MVPLTKTGPIWIVSGTRPEVIKLAPLYFALKKRFGADVRWISTGQHMALEEETLHAFAITPDVRVQRRHEGEAILDYDAHLIEGLARLQRDEPPRLVIVQGDTASTFSGAFAAFHASIPVAHVEAGLRSNDIYDPFPEEAYRRMVDTMTTLYFPPTGSAARNLIAEGVDPRRVMITGNTSVDALEMIDGNPLMSPAPEGVSARGDRRLIFVTMHRRESWGQPMENLCNAVRDIVRAHDDVEVVLPVHVNPEVRRTVRGILGAEPRVNLTEPLDYATCHYVIRRSHLILTDSGGVSEEAPSYHVPTLILRRTTERPEAVEAGIARLVGTDRARVLAEANRLLDDPDAYAAMKNNRNPYGDGRAADRITLAIARFFDGVEPLLSNEEQFE